MRPRRRRGAARRRRRRCRCSSWRPTGTTRRPPRREDTRREAATNSIPVRAAMRISEWQTLFPSPRYVSRTPASRPKRSRIVIASARAWSGCGVGETVDDRDRRVLGERVDLRLVGRWMRIALRSGDDRGVAGRLAACELQVGGGHVERHPAELGDPDLRADPRPRRRLPEDEADGATGEDAEARAVERASTFSSSARSSASASSSLQSETRVKLRPLSVRDARHCVDGTRNNLT